MDNEIKAFESRLDDFEKRVSALEEDSEQRRIIFKNRIPEKPMTCEEIRAFVEEKSRH